MAEDKELERRVATLEEIARQTGVVLAAVNAELDNHHQLFKALLGQKPEGDW